MLFDLGPTPNLAPVFAAQLVMAGFLGSVSVNVMSQIFSLVSEPKFADYLRQEKIFDQYIFWPQFNLIIQITFIFTSVVCVIWYIAFKFDLAAIRIILGNFGFMVYAVSKTWNIVDMVRVLAWNRRVYQSLQLESGEDVKTH